MLSTRIMTGILRKPKVTEKTVALAKSNLYTFVVSKETTKKQIAKLVKEKFKVDVLSVKTVNIKGKFKSQRSRKGYFQTAPLKKAIVQTKPGQKIAIFESIEKEEEVQVQRGEDQAPKVLKEKKSLLGTTKVRVEKEASQKSTEINELGKTSKKEAKKKGKK